MFEKTYLIIIIIFQAIISGFIFVDRVGAFSWSEFFAPIGTLVLVIGFFIGYYKLKKEITFKERLDVHEKVTSFLVEKLLQSLYQSYPFINNGRYIEISQPKIKDDYFVKLLREHNSKLINKISDFQTNFQFFYDFFSSWKALFSEKIDRELKFLFDLHGVYSEDLNEYQRKLGDYSMLSLMKSEFEIEKQKRELILFEKKLSRKNNVLSNGLIKLVLDISREVFDGLYKRSNDEEERLFGSEIENLVDGDKAIFLTDKGFKYQTYKKTKFQKEFGGFRDRKRKLREFIEKN